MLWSFTIISLLFVVLRYFDLHRVSPSDEQIGINKTEFPFVFKIFKFGATTGLDLACHKEMAYDFDSEMDVTEKPIFTGNLLITVSS